MNAEQTSRSESDPFFSGLLSGYLRIMHNPVSIR